MPMPEGSSAELLMRLSVDKRWVAVPMAVFAAAMALPAIKALMFEDPEAIDVIKVFLQKSSKFFNFSPKVFRSEVDSLIMGKFKHL